MVLTAAGLRLTAVQQVNQGLVGNYRDILTTYWQQTINHLETETHDYKLHQLPLARIKKVMKADPDVKMISAEAPILFAKGCDIFITELTMRAWIHAEENKRRTLQRSDIASALARSDMFDFLIDIVPREEAATKRQGGPGGANTATATASGGSMIPPQPQGIAQTGQAQGQSQQHHISGEYGIPANQLRGQDDYQPQPGVYAPQMSQAVGESYPQPAGPMFEGMYYPPMASQQVSQTVRTQSCNSTPACQSANGNANLSVSGRSTALTKDRKFHQVLKIPDIIILGTMVVKEMRTLKARETMMSAEVAQIADRANLLI